MAEQQKKQRPEWWPIWYDGSSINEAIYCREFRKKYKLLYSNNAFFTVDGLMADDTPLREAIFR